MKLVNISDTFYTLKDLSDFQSSGYKYCIVLGTSTNNKNCSCIAFLFNSEINFKSSQEGLCITTPSNFKLAQFGLYCTGMPINSWSYYGIQESGTIYDYSFFKTGFTIVGGSENIVSVLKSESMSEFHFDEETSFNPVSPLRNCVVSQQVKDISFSETLSEVTGILPIVMVVLVSFLAIRKGIDFLTNSLRKS